MKLKNLFKGLILCAIILNQATSFGQSVVINEIVTDPQQDWSSTSFTTSPGGTGTTNDEWIELYIKSAGIDLTGWTIELNDTTPVSGDLTNTGAFDVSNYITSGTGTFTNTEAGDFLVLGNVLGGGSMNNSITINLKDSGGVIIDTVTIGGGIGEAPSGNSSNIGDESIQRMPNGADTNVDNIDFSKGVTSLGTSNPTQISWDGSSNTDWSKAINWAAGSLPGASDKVFISSGLTNYPTISTGTAVTINNITLQSGASLIAEGTSTVTGTVTYNRTINYVTGGNYKGWYLVSSPLSGQAYNNTYATTNGLAISGSKRGLATYASGWSYLLDNDTNAGSFIPGKGYSIKKEAVTGAITFSGNLNTDNAGVDVVLSTSGNRINLLGNPYTSFLSSATFLTNESAISETKTMWVYNQTLGANGQYEVKTVAQDFKIAPGQGFFVTANVAGGTFNFSEANQIHNADTFQKGLGNKTEITISITDGEINNYGKIYYLDNATTALDIGYDGELFTGQTNSFAVYSHLVSDSEGKNYQIQSLPNADFENMVIPIGVNAASGKEITFTAEALNLPSGIKVILEDRLTNTFTRLDEENANYKIVLTETLKGIGRFYLHTSQKALSVNSNLLLENISLYKTNKSTLRIVGLPREITTVKLFNILGKQILNSSFISDGVKDILLPKLASGVYVIQLETENGKLNKKIILE